jgi:hypothetical protein
LLLVIVGQPSMAGTAVSLPAALDGGSRGVPHLNGTIHVSDSRIEFEAFPQVENLTFSCGTFGASRHPRRNGNVITIYSSGLTYRFDIYSTLQAERLMTLINACKQA